MNELTGWFAGLLSDVMTVISFDDGKNIGDRNWNAQFDLNAVNAERKSSFGI